MDEYDAFMHQWNVSGCLDNATDNEEICSKILRRYLNNTLPLTFGQQSSTKFQILKGVSISLCSLSILLKFTLMSLHYKDPMKRFRNSSSFLILNFVIADISGASLRLLQNVYKPKDQMIIKITLWLLSAALLCSFGTAMFVAFDRYVAIAFPFQYRAMDRTKRTIVVNTTVWLFSLSLCSILFFIPSIFNSLAPSVVYPVNIFILFAVILVFYSSTHRRFRQQRKQLFNLNTTNQQLRQQKLKTEKNLANTMLLVSFSLILFTTPYMLMFFFIQTNCLSCIMNTHFLEFWLYWPFLFPILYVTNPIIYAWKIPVYRKSLKQLLNTLF